MKIDFFIDVLGSGGAQTQLLKLANGFKKRNCSVRIIIYHKENFHKEYIQINGIEVLFIEKVGFIGKIKKLRSILFSNKTDVLISFLERPNIIATLASLPYRSWKLILGERSANPHILTSFKLKLFRVLHSCANFVVANSYANLSLVKKVNPFLREKNCKVVYNIVDEFITSDHITKRESFTNKSPIKLIVGASLRDVKNSIGLVQALVILPIEIREKFNIVWFGDPPYIDDSYEKTLETVKNNNLESVIQFFPASNNFREEIIKSDLVCLFSKYEGFPNVLCEAMISGKPVLATPVSDLPLIIPHRNIQLVSSFKAEDIAIGLQKISEITAQELINIGVDNKRIALEKFNEDQILDQYQKLF